MADTARSNVISFSTPLTQSGLTGHNSGMREITVAKAKNQFSDLLRRAEHGGERLIIHRHGKPVAALLPMQDLRRIEALEDEEDLRDGRASIADAEAHGTYSLESVLREHNLQHLLVRETPPSKKEASQTKRSKEGQRRPGKGRRSAS